MRNDALGLFWRDEPPEPKVKKETIKCIPPEPVWLKDDYLPGLDEALAMPIEIMNANDIQESLVTKDKMLFDIECYQNYFLASFRSYKTGKVFYFESFNSQSLNITDLSWFLKNFQTIGFNSLSYDLIITSLALNDVPNEELKIASDMLIIEGIRGTEILKQYKTKKLKCDHIDLIEIAPLRASLKIYGGRLHVPRMQDLPFHPNTILTKEQAAIVRWYNLNSDLTSTGFLYNSVTEQIKLRETLSSEINIDLRSKSDAQIAEIVIVEEYKKLTGRHAIKPQIDVNAVYRYNVPYFLKFETPLLNSALNIISQSFFAVDATGSIGMPEAIKSLKLTINDSVYQMGIGGLHSTESCIFHRSDDEYVLRDVDATSYYPFIILNLNLFPPQLGREFLTIYKSIVDRRITAKKQGNKVIADSLKITINGSYGKFGNMYSFLYSPDLIIQVTLTGQLSLLMLIEKLELSGIRVVSANTDGIVIKCPRKNQEFVDQIIKSWEMSTGFKTEESIYQALYSRDVNNYLAIKDDGSVKRKGAFSNPSDKFEQLWKNPSNGICIKALEKFLIDRTPITTTILNHKDIRDFITVRTVKGGAVKIWPDKTEYLGKAIRWYYANGVEGNIVYASKGSKVPRSDGAKPVLDLPTEFPNDINYEWYIAEAEKMLISVGYK